MLQGRLITVPTTKIGVAYLAFTLWLMVCIVFSTWPGRSMYVLTDQWYKALLTFFLAAGILYTVKQCRTVIKVLAAATILLSLMTLAFRTVDNDGRLIFAFTRYRNPNDLGMVLVASIPLIGFLVAQSGKIGKTIGTLSIIPVLICISKTGSRGAMVGVAMLICATFIKASMFNKVKLLAALMTQAFWLSWLCRRIYSAVTLRFSSQGCGDDPD